MTLKCYILQSKSQCQDGTLHDYKPWTGTTAEQEFSEFIRAGKGVWRVMKPVLKLKTTRIY